MFSLSLVIYDTNWIKSHIESFKTLPFSIDLEELPLVFKLVYL